MTYHNSTNERTVQRSLFTDKAEKQQTEVYAHFIELGSASPSQIFKLLSKYLITSIRRAITDLTTLGYLVKTEQKRVGMWGRPEYIWQLNNRKYGSNTQN